MASTTNNRFTKETDPADRLSAAWPSQADRENDLLLADKRAPDKQAARDDSLEASSEVALLCANIQADVGQATPFGDLAGLLQTLYALTTAVANAETRPARTR